MKFSQFSKYLQRLESTSKRLEMTAILTEFIEELGTDEVDKGLYLALGYLKAPFESEKFNIADKMMAKILNRAYNKELSEIQTLYSKLGDLGNVAYEIDTNKSIAGIDVVDVHKSLLEIAQTSGAGSQEAKITKLSALLKKLDRLSAKYVVRIVLGTTRLGFTELTVLDALTKLVGKGKQAKKQIEDKYNMHPDIGLIAQEIKDHGLKGMDSINMETGVPVLAQKPQRLSNPEEILEKMDGEAWAEYKFDGTRVQLHLDRDKESKVFVKTYTRNLEETTHQFPDIIEAAEKQVNADSIILDGEAIAYDKDTGKFLPFQEVIKRKRKYDVKEMAKEIPLRYFVFDILYLNGKSLMSLPFSERRSVLDGVIKKGQVIEIDKHVEAKKPEELSNFFEDSKEKGLEGLVIKNPKSEYQAGARSFAWIKLKKSDTELLEDDFDCVVLGYYFGKGVRSGFGIGGFLVGVYDPKALKFRSLTKIGTGLKEDDWTDLKNRIDKIAVKEKPKNVDVNKDLYPNVWAQPELVVVVKADEITKSPIHTAEYALRFPRFIKIRTDKKPEDSTSVKEIESLYKSQKRGYY